MAGTRQVEIAPGIQMPKLGLGVWQVPDNEAEAAVKTAIACGYRSIDTAAIYENEKGTGDGVRAAGLPRNETFLTTKLWNDRHTDARAALNESLERLGVDHVDLYLIHWPAPKRNRCLDAWRTLIALRDEGLTRAIGVSNFQMSHLRLIMDQTGVVPAVNQIELHPYLQQKELRDFHNQNGIVTEAYSPIGRGRDLLKEPVIGQIARVKGKSPAQIVLAWHLRIGNIVIPKSVTPSRIQENSDVFGFDLDRVELEAITGLDRKQRLGGDPDAFD